MIISNEERRKQDRKHLRYLMKHPLQLCYFAWQHVRFMWWLTGNHAQRGVRQTREIRFWYAVRRLIRKTPEDRGVCQRIEP